MWHVDAKCIQVLVGNWKDTTAWNTKRILKYIVWRSGILRVCGLDSCGSGKVPTVDTTEHDNELSGAIKFREIFD